MTVPCLWMSISEIVFAVGFKDSGYFSKCLRKKYMKTTTGDSSVVGDTAILYPLSAGIGLVIRPIPVSYTHLDVYKRQ